MSVTFRQYSGPDDYWRVDEFLIEHHQPGNLDGNWLEPAWEYMHGHPCLDVASLEKIGIWEDVGKIVAVVHYESSLGEACFQFHPAYRRLRQEMLGYTEETLTGPTWDGAGRYLKVYVNDSDAAFASLVKARGYEKDAEEARPLARFVIPDPFPAITLPAGFCLKSLADDDDWGKVYRLLWRGFGNLDEPPINDEELESRKKMFDTPKARRDLKIVVQAPNGDFVALCGMFYEPTGRFAYVEPVATDPDYRRMGLGKAAVLEGIRRCAALGAAAAYVGADLEFYQTVGFQKVYDSECWGKSVE
jgi:GNAT superfamily N-acetyltransferase